MSDTFDVGGDLTVNRLGFGAMRLTGENIVGPPEDEAEARRVVERAVELGVDFVDTADSYGPGVSERILGEVLGDERGPTQDDGVEPRSAGGSSEHRPRDVVVATKAGVLRNADGDWLPHGDPDYVRNQVLASRDRLGVDVIDLYQLHRPDPDVPLEESVRAFAELKEEGLVRHVGLSNVDVEQLERARDIVEVATVQNRYHVGDREDEAVLEACEEYDIGFVPWNPLGVDDLGEKAAVVDDVADAHDATRSQVALAWLLEHSPVTLPIPGTSSVEHLEENVAAADLELTDDEYARLAE